MQTARRRIERRAALEAGETDFDGRWGPYSEVLTRVLTARRIVSAKSLDFSLSDLIKPALLDRVENAASLLAEAVRRDRRITIVGDFDADGATGTVVGKLALESMGCTRVTYVVPSRFKDGYGLSGALAERVARTQNPDVVITVDNGIASFDGADVLRERGIQLIITDHHLPGETLPRADAIVNPNLEGSRFPSPSLSGVGVMFYLMLALRRNLRDAGWFGAEKQTEPNLAALLDLVAIGTVSDLVPLDENNRILVAQGVARIRTGSCRPGIRALIRRSGREIGEISASDLGYVIGPRLNAAGRLEEMSTGIECLLADSDETAAPFASELESLNQSRKQLQSEMSQQAEVAVAAKLATGDAHEALCLYDKAWHQGLVGLIASRIKDRCHVPVIAFADADDDFLKGSGRSIEGLHLRDVFAEMDRHHPGLITRFGGHAMAVGLTLKREQLDRFSEVFVAETVKILGSDAQDPAILTDGPLGQELGNLEFAKLIKGVVPWGKDCPEPTFDNEFKVLNVRVVGDAHLKFSLRADGVSESIDGIAFGQVGPEGEVPRFDRIRTVYRVDVNRYRGESSPQLIVEYFEPA